MARFHALKVKEVRRETAEAVSVAFDVPMPLQPEFQFKQGQYITIKMQLNGEELRRSYSLCTSPYGDKEWRVAIKEVEGGRMSTFINRTLKAGDVLEVMTPMGNFHSVLSGSNQKQYVLFAGGSGITPMMSIIRSVLYVEKKSKLTLVYANRNETSAIFKAELERLASENTDRLQVIYTYDQPAQAGDDLLTGMLSVEKINAIAQRFALLDNQAEYFICGPGPMMENVKQSLQQKHIPETQIHIEYFSAVVDAVNKAAGDHAGKDVKSKVTVLQYGIETNFDLETSGLSILDAALEAGVDVPFSCKGAVCCTCRAKVLEGKARMDANFALTDAEVAEGYILTCQAHPETEKLVVDYDAI